MSSRNSIVEPQLHEGGTCDTCVLTVPMSTRFLPIMENPPATRWPNARHTNMLPLGGDGPKRRKKLLFLSTPVRVCYCNYENA